MAVAEVILSRCKVANGRPARGMSSFESTRVSTVGGHRNSEALENALAQPGITPAVIDKLIARRLLRREDRDRRTRLELTHDVLTGVVQRSRDERRIAEAAERTAAEEREHALQLERETRTAKRVSRVVTVAAVVRSSGPTAQRSRSTSTAIARTRATSGRSRGSSAGTSASRMRWRSRRRSRR